MRGRGLSQRLKNINLKNDMELEKIEEIEEIPGIKTPPRQIKSPTKFASPHSAFQPYDKITALGPGGLTSMLKSLRDARTARAKGLNGGQISGDLTNEAYPSSSNKSDNDIANNYQKLRETCHSLELSDLEKKIIRQIEYYFGDYNLPKDKWMLEKLEDLEGGWFDMEMMMTFPRLKSLTEDPNIVLTSLAKSSNDLLQVENWGSGKGRIRRAPNKPLPELNEARQNSELERTMFVWGFDKTKTSLDDLIEFFEKGFENVVNIRRRTIPSIENPKDYTKREFIGSVWVTFGTRQDAEDFFELRRELRFDGQKLNMKWKKDYIANRIEFNDEFIEESIERTVAAIGFNSKDTKKEDLVEFFKRFPGAMTIRKRVYRYASESNEWHFTGCVFINFDTLLNAQRFMANAQDKKLVYNEDNLSVKWATQFYEEKGRFRQALASLKASKEQPMDEA